MNGITKTKSRITTLQTILSVVVPVAIIIYLVGQNATTDSNTDNVTYSGLCSPTHRSKDAEQ